MFPWVLNTPPEIIEKINFMFKVSYFLENVFAFDRLKMFVFRSSLRKIFYKTGVLENEATIKTYCFYRFMFKISILDLFKQAFW